MPGPSPLNSACRCCINPPSTSLAIQYVSAWQSCTTTGCGELPCTSTPAVYDNEGKCSVPAQVCSPNWATLTRAEKCAAKRYLTITTVDTSGGGTHGRTQLRQYTIDAEGNCDLEVTCSGSSTTTTEINAEDSDSGSSSNPQGTYTYNYSCSHTETNITVRTYNADCTVTETTTCSGSASSSANSRTGYEYTSAPDFFVSQTSTCTSTKNSNCGWTSTSTSLFSFGGGGGTPNTSTGTNPCACANYETTVTIEPPPNCQVSVTYTGENQQGYCTPKQFPSFPSFTQCTPEGQEPPEPPQLQPGQGYGSEAYKYENPNNPQIKSEQKVKYRVEHGPTGTCYLKVWFRKKIQQWKYEDCDTGFPGDPPRTFEWQVECEDLSGGDPEVPATPQCPNEEPVNQEQPETINEGPQVCITGPNPIPVNVTRTYTEYGATAFGIIAPEVPPDPQTGEGGSPAEYGCLPVEIDGDVDTSTCGTQYVTYSATDATGNETKVFRTVVVRSTSLSPCSSRWSTAGEPTYQDIPGPYEWVGSGYPCFEDNDKMPEACENKIYSAQEYNLTAGLNQSVSIEYKYSFVKDYEPNWPDEYGCVGCRPNGFPTVPITTACSICEPTSCTHC